MVSQCGTKGAAHCFTMIDDIEQKVHWRCYDSDDFCSVARQEHQSKHRVLEFSECQRTADVSAAQPSYLTGPTRGLGAVSPHHSLTAVVNDMGLTPFSIVKRFDAIGLFCQRQSKMKQQTSEIRFARMYEVQQRDWDM